MRFECEKLRVFHGFSPSLCGVLVFDSVSRSGPAASADFVITHSLSHNFVTHHLSYTTLSYTLFHTQILSTHTHNFVTHHPSFTPGDIYRRLAWQAWHLATSTFVSRGRRGTYGTGQALVARLGPLGRAVTPRHFGWQAWRLRA